MSTATNQLESTAYWTPSVRALESAGPDRLFNDPWAAALAGDIGAGWIAQRPPASVLPIVLRTRYFDDFVQRIVHDEGVRQLVLLAAGLDTRAFRLDLPAATYCFELDRQDILAYKNAILGEAGAQPICSRHTVGVNLTGAWREALLAAGFSADVPACWLLEGFLFYLPSEDVTRLLDEVTTLAAPGSWLGFDIINGPMLTSPITKAWIEMQAQSGAPWIGTMDDPVAFLAERGWQAGLTQAGAPDANHGRWVLPVIPVTMPDMPHNWYVTAQKSDYFSGETNHA